MKDILENVANGIVGPIATVHELPIPKANGVPWVRLVLQLTTKSPPITTRPLLAVIVPPSRWPVTVEQHHDDPRQTTGYRFEWKRDPNVKHDDNPPTIDNRAELVKVIEGVMGLDETQLIIKRMSE